MFVGEIEKIEANKKHLSSNELTHFKEFRSANDFKCFSKSYHEVVCLINPLLWTSIKKTRWNEFLFQLKMFGNSFLNEYYQLKSFLKTINDHGIIAIRQTWEYSITSKCECDNEIPCLECNGCWKKFLQLLFVIKCASGVSGKIVLDYWKNIFESPPYCFFGLE